MMFGPRLSTVFASRWKALLWAASVLFSVWCFVPKQGDDDDAGDAQAAAKMVAGLLPGGQPSAAPSRSPWAPDQPQPKH